MSLGGAAFLPVVLGILSIRGDMDQEGRAVVWQSEGCRFDPTLGVSKCP